MSIRAWAYVSGVLLIGIVLIGQTLNGVPIPVSELPAFTLFAFLAALGQLLMANAPKHQSYHANILFFFAGALVLHPFYFVSIVAIAHLIEWALERWQKGPRLRNWYLQPFNMSVHIFSGLAARGVYYWLESNLALTPITTSSFFAAILAVLTYVVVNRMAIGEALVLARQVSWHESGVLEFENFVTEFIMLCLGYVVSLLWTLNPLLILPALAPLVLIYQALKIPQLKREASTDEKTGLWNARHFARLFSTELERTKRQNRPMAVIMADLDMLRSINNTYGHLAGDVVLAGIAGIIRKTVRQYDIAGRFGGEEFCIVLPETGPSEARAIAERVREAVKAATFEPETSPSRIRATLSLGIACFPGDADTANGLIHQADIAVYQAKLKGRNCVVQAGDVPRRIKKEYFPTNGRLDRNRSDPVVSRKEAMSQLAKLAELPSVVLVNKNGKRVSESGGRVRAI